MSDVKLGILLWSQAATWPEMLDAAKRVDQLGYEHLWTWDHLYAIFGDPYQPIFEGPALLAAWARETQRTRLGLLVGANTFRNPGLVAKLTTTIDHASDGRAILGIGGAWMEPEHTAHGIDFGTGFGQRLDWLDESAGAIRRLLDGESVTSEPGGHYHFDKLRQAPVPVQPHLPIMIGGGGEKKTLRTVAKYADMWNGMGPLDLMAHKLDVLREHCAAVGRDFDEIELTLGIKATIRDTEAEAVRVWHDAMNHNRTPMANVEDDFTFWNGTSEQLADRLRPYVQLGFRTVITEQPAPYDIEQRVVEAERSERGPLADPATERSQGTDRRDRTRRVRLRPRRHTERLADERQFPVADAEIERQDLGQDDRQRCAVGGLATRPDRMAQRVDEPDASPARLADTGQMRCDEQLRAGLQIGPIGDRALQPGRNRPDHRKRHRLGERVRVAREQRLERMRHRIDTRRGRDGRRQPDGQGRIEHGPDRQQRRVADVILAADLLARDDAEGVGL